MRPFVHSQRTRTAESRPTDPDIVAFMAEAQRLCPDGITIRYKNGHTCRLTFQSKKVFIVVVEATKGAIGSIFKEGSGKKPWKLKLRNGRMLAFTTPESLIAGAWALLY